MSGDEKNDQIFRHVATISKIRNDMAKWPETLQDPVHQCGTIENNILFEKNSGRAS